MSRPRRANRTSTARRTGVSSRPSGRSRRRSCAGTWRSMPSGPASISGTGRARWRRSLVKWGRLLHEAAMPLAHTAQRHAGLGARSAITPAAVSPSMLTRRLKPARPTLTSRPPRKPRPRSSACRGNCFMTASHFCSKGRSQPASAAGCPAQRASASPSSPRRSASCSSPRGRRTTRAATSIIARARCRWSRRWKRCPAWSSSTSSARPRCRRCATSSTAPGAPASRITSSTSTATASMTPPSASAGSASSSPRTPASSRSAATSSPTPTRSARCCAITASRSSSSTPARPRRPSRRPSRSRPSC